MQTDAHSTSLLAISSSSPRPRTRGILPVLICAMLAATPLISSAATYLVTDLGVSTPAGERNSVAFAISAQGEVVGKYDTGSGNFHALLWSNGTATDLGTLGGGNSSATGAADVNGELEIVGQADLTGGTNAHAFLWAADSMADLGVFSSAQPNQVNSSAAGINASGQIVGSSEGDLILGEDAFLWLPSGNLVFGVGNFTDLGTFAGGNMSNAYAINSDGVAVGASEGFTIALGNYTHAFFTDGGNALVDLGVLSAGTSTATAANEHGLVVGTSTTASSQLHAFAFNITSSTIVDLGVFDTFHDGGYTESHALGVNNNDQVVGYCLGNYSAADSEHAFIYEDGQITDLNTLTNNTTFVLNRAYAINANGQIVGVGTDTLSGHVHAFVLTPVLHLPRIVVQPSSVTILQGRNARFSVAASSTTTLTYQWYKNGVALAGQTNSALTIQKVGAASSGSYYVVISNEDGSVRSVIVKLKVVRFATRPRITVQPRAVLALRNSTVNLKVTATGTAPLGYQWEKGRAALENGGQISGAETARLRIRHVSLANSGAYRVVVTNPAGSVTSAVVRLRIRH